MYKKFRTRTPAGEDDLLPSRPSWTLALLRCLPGLSPLGFWPGNIDERSFRTRRKAKYKLPKTLCLAPLRTPKNGTPNRDFSHVTSHPFRVGSLLCSDLICIVAQSARAWFLTFFRRSVAFPSRR